IRIPAKPAWTAFLPHDWSGFEPVFANSSQLGAAEGFAIFRPRARTADDSRDRIGSMSRASVAEHTKRSVFLARGWLRKLVARAAGHPVLNWSLPAKTDRLVISPQDLRTADTTRASEIYAGRFVFAGKVVTCDARSPFEIAPPSEDWAIALLGFGWLRHLRAADSGITRANARALVDEWITSHSTLEPIAWRPEVLARRIISWLSQATLL